MHRLVRKDSVMFLGQVVLGAFLVLSCTGCKCLYMKRMPIEVTIVDGATKEPIPGATAELVWRVKFGGEIWGKSVILTTDENGKVCFTKKNVPPVDERGYRLKGEPMDYVMIDRVIVEADGYEMECVFPPRSRLPAVLMLQRGTNPVDEAESPVPESAGPAKLQTKARSVSNVVDVGSQPAGE
jgi:hypothetical protein